MDNYFWLVVIPNLASFFKNIGIVGIVASGIGGFISLCWHDEKNSEKEHKFVSWCLKISAKIFLASMTIFFIICFMPTKKDVIQLKAISIVSELKGVDQIPQKLINRLNDLLDGEEK